jgi:CheY-like chemotaxis protein
MDRCVVVIDDNSRNLARIVEVLREAGFNVMGFTKAKLALDYAERAHAAVVVTEVLMPDMDGIEVLRFIQRELPHIGVVAMSGNPETLDTNYLSAMAAFGAAETLAKPIERDTLVAAVTRVHRKHCAPCSGGDGT